MTTLLPTARRSRTALLLVLGLLLALVGLAPSAAPAAAKESGAGWVRLAHLSPDTPSVNVSLTSFGGSESMLKLSDVGYGDVSAYQKVPAGRYVASMTPAGGTAQSTPSITQAVTVADGRAYTVAAVGDNANLRGTVLDDDLRTPKAGSAKVRLLQAAVSAPTATVTAVGGPVLAQDAAFGSSTGYATIEAGVWDVQIAPAGAAPVDTTVTAQPGSVNTIVLLDGPSGQVTAKVVKDASASPKAPKKGTGVDTGGGGTATSFVGGRR
ncbi:protein of unknown function [Microlunatus sagamiharensis]|uniref:DUF4397 domain-containing protein n=1 Tax=Microlunatus sagamiharensis TaxID=546874 RepID=A0A1H2LQW3_9ACTN|nr:DUF4397 domain-containing protein [Microlunatus sagamiharensis]SDU83400.1 protein of unknown function [Microlunatus sagamiharensis]